MGINRTNDDVKFGRTIRLGKNLDLDNATSGQVEIGSLRDTGSFIERWDGDSWEIIGPGVWVRPPTTVTGNTTVTTDDDVILVDATSGNITVTLFTTVGNIGKVLRIKKIDSSSNSMTIDAAGSETIDGATTQSTITQYNSYTIVSATAEWSIV